jgi:Tfp pilus assembly protein PilV
MSGHREVGPQTSSLACSTRTMIGAGRSTEGGSGMSERIAIGRRGHGDSRDGGFTLIEAIVASVILLIAGTAVITALIATGTWYSSANTRAQATSLAAQQLAWVRSRSYDQIAVGVGDIYETTTTVTSIGSFSVETSITSVVDTATQIPMKRILVSVSTLTMASPVSLVGYATETTSSPDQQSYVPVTVGCVPEVEVNFTNPTAKKDNNDTSSFDNTGTPVQLRDINNLDQVDYSALTNGNNVAAFPAVQVGQYWMTVDTAYPVVHAYRFPQRVIVTPDSLNTFYLGVTQPDSSGANQAYLRVGAYTAGGSYFDGSGNLVAPIPYAPVEGLTIYAQPQFNESYPGYPSLPLFPSNANMIYSGVVNSYGVAVIKIPWTLDPSDAASAGQVWKVWARTSSRSWTGTTNASGRWISFAQQGNDNWSLLTKPEQPASGSNADIPQFTYVTGTPQ